MLDDFQDDDGNSNFLDELESYGLDDLSDAGSVKTSKSRSNGKKLFGMTPPQRLLIALEFFLLALTLSSLCLLVFNKIVPPF
ncbi:MAG: hypothetical protein N2C13_00975 [Chloroflexota bacterium]